MCQHSITPLALPCKLLIPDRGTWLVPGPPGGGLGGGSGLACQARGAGSVKSRRGSRQGGASSLHPAVTPEGCHRCALGGDQRGGLTAPASSTPLSHPPWASRGACSPNKSGVRGGAHAAELGCCVHEPPLCPGGCAKTPNRRENEHAQGRAASPRPGPGSLCSRRTSCPGPSQRRSPRHRVHPEAWRTLAGPCPPRCRSERDGHVSGLDPGS